VEATPISLTTKAQGRTRGSPAGLFALVAGVVLLAQLLIAWSDAELLLAKVLPDDAFYYFGTARHIAAGQDVTFDGRTITNGFHPLWMALLAPVYALAGKGSLPIHLALTLSALLNVGTGVLVFSSVRRVAGNAWAGFISAAAFLLNPAVMLETLNGLETALSLFAFAAVFAFYRLRLAGPGAARAPLSTYLVLGGLAGLTCLARTDNAFLVALIGLALAWQGRARMAGRLTIAALAGAIVLAPWFAWSWLALGTPLQSSGSAMPSILRDLYATSIRAGTLTAARALDYFVGGAVRGAVMAFSYYAGVSLLVVILGIGVWRVLRPRLPASRWGEVLAPVSPYLLPIAAVLITLLIHTVYRWYPRTWYFAPAALVFALPVGPALAGVAGKIRGGLRRPRTWAAALALLVGAIFLAQGIKAWRAGIYPWQASFLAGARWVQENTAAGERVGAFNAGILGYYGDRETVNLDGVTDPAAQRAIHERRLAAYAQERRLRYVIDYRNYVEDMYQPFYGTQTPSWLRPIATVGAPHAPYGVVTVYEVLPASGE